MDTFERMDYLESAHHIVDEFDVDVTHEDVDAMSDHDLAEWVDGFYGEDFDDSGDVAEARSLNL